jgi:hypothetical protein
MNIHKYPEIARKRGTKCCSLASTVRAQCEKGFFATVFEVRRPFVLAAPRVNLSPTPSNSNALLGILSFLRSLLIAIYGG